MAGTSATPPSRVTRDSTNSSPPSSAESPRKSASSRKPSRPSYKTKEPPPPAASRKTPPSERGKDSGALVVKGSLHGHATPDGLSPIVISASGKTAPIGQTNVAIGSLRIGGSVERANIFGGDQTDLTPSTAIAQIASNLVCGVQNLGADDTTGGTGANADNVNFGDTHDFPIGSGDIANRIAKIVIGGIAGTEASGDHFGFSSANIGSFKSLHFTAPLTPAPNAIELSKPTGDATIREA